MEFIVRIHLIHMNVQSHVLKITTNVPHDSFPTVAKNKQDVLNVLLISSTNAVHKLLTVQHYVSLMRKNVKRLDGMITGVQFHQHV